MGKIILRQERITFLIQLQVINDAKKIEILDEIRKAIDEEIKDQKDKIDKKKRMKPERKNIKKEKIQKKADNKYSKIEAPKIKNIKDFMIKS